MAGYELGLASIRESLQQMIITGIKDVNYWKDSIRWSSKSSNAVNDRTFCLSALQIMFQVHEQLQEAIRLDVVRATCNIHMSLYNVEVLEKVLWVLAETIGDGIECEEPCVKKLVGTVTQTVISSGTISSIRFEVLPSLLRLSAKVSPDELFLDLAQFITSDKEIPGKVLWTLADVLPSSLYSMEGKDENLGKFWLRFGQMLVKASSMKAKQHIARACCRLVQRDDCPITIKYTLIENLRICREWLDRAEPLDLDVSLFVKYQDALLTELNAVPL